MKRMSNKNRIMETLKKERVLSIANILIMTITFLVLGTFLSLVFISQSTLAYLEQQTQVTAFFKDDFTEDKILELQKQMESDERILSTEYISKQKALEIFMDINKDEPSLLESVSANILPASLNIKAKQIDNLQVIAEELTKVEGVEGVKFFRDVVESFQTIANIIYVVGFVLSTIFLFISYTTIVLLLRTYINRKGTELSILRLVGASKEYVRKPILVQGLFFSTVSSVLATALIFIIAFGIQRVYGFSQGLTIPFSEGKEISILAFSTILSGIILLSGFILGLTGSASTVKKYLEY